MKAMSLTLGIKRNYLSIFFINLFVSSSSFLENFLFLLIHLSFFRYIHHKQLILSSVFGPQNISGALSTLKVLQLMEENNVCWDLPTAPPKSQWTFKVHQGNEGLHPKFPPFH